MTDIILETFDLSKNFKGFSAVKDVNLQVSRGAIHALIGPNGAGKTTVFNLLTKFLQPSSGKIMYNGIDITGEESADIARRGIVRSFQISAVFPQLTAMENVRIALQRKAGTEFHFWKSERVLSRLYPRAGLASPLINLIIVLVLCVLGFALINALPGHRCQAAHCAYFFTRLQAEFGAGYTSAPRITLLTL